MVFWLILFIVSGAAMIIIIVLKAIQERSGMLLFWPNQRELIEKKLTVQSSLIRTEFEKINKNTLYTVLHYFVENLKKIFAHAHHRLDQKSTELSRVITGRKSLEERGQGKASHFLHDIRSFKDRFQGK